MKKQLDKHLFRVLIFVLFYFLGAFLTSISCAAATPAIWDGTVATEYAGGDGTEADPYQIATGEQLALLASTCISNSAGTAGKYYILTANILLNNVSGDDWTTTAQAWYYTTSESYCFRGNLNGNGHVVRGIYIDQDKTTSGTYGGLFGSVAYGALIKDLGITDSDITAYFAGSFSGYIRNVADAVPSFSNCYADSSVSIEGTYAGGFIGGCPKPVGISNCYFTGAVAADSRAGGLIGSIWATSATSPIQNCYVATAGENNVTGNTWSYVALTNVYSTSTTTQTGVTNLTLAQMTGAAAETNMTGFDFTNTWSLMSNDTPQLEVFSPTNSIWNGTVATAYAGGDGSGANPYQIANGKQLALLASTCISNSAGTAGKYFILTADIFLNDVSLSDWMTTAQEWYYVTNNAHCFRGILNGNGHEIKGIYINQDTTTTVSYAGLFGSIAYGAVIKNLGITNSDITAYYSGSFSGYICHVDDEIPSINYCYADSSVSIEGKYAGGVMGGCPRPISINNSYFTGTVTANSRAGGLIGSIWATSDTSTIQNCYVATTGSNSITGNIWNYIEFTNVFSTSTTTQTGVTNLTLTQMTGTAAETNMTGFDFDRVWLSEENNTPTLREFASRSIWGGTIATAYSGGSGTEADPYQIATGEQLALLSSTCISNSAGTAGVYYILTSDILLNDVSSEDWTSMAQEWYHITNSAYCFRGTLNGNGHVIKGIYIDQDKTSSGTFGGLFGSIAYGAVIKNLGISNSYISAYYAGSFSGYMTHVDDGIPSISQCFASSSVSVEGTYAGGFIGGCPKPVNISDCYFIGTVTGESRAGGLLGSIWATTATSTIQNCYVATMEGNNVTGNTWSYVAFTNVYSNLEQSGVTKLKLSSMQGERAQINMTGFDFNNIWEIVEDGTPVLKVFLPQIYTFYKIPVTITFVANGGTTVAPIAGYGGDTISWPTVTRSGYTFDYWSVYDTLDVPYPYDSFQEYDMTLYAKWLQNEYSQGFEDYPYQTAGEDGLGEDYEYYNPNTSGYSSQYVHSGSDSIHRLGVDTTAGYQDFSLFDSTIGSLEKGKTYILSFYIYVESIGGTDVDLSLVHTNSLNMSVAEISSETICAVDSLSQGSWQEVTYTFVAEAEYVALQTPGLCSLYFDDISITLTDDLVTTQQSGNWSGPDGYVIVLPASSSATLEHAAEMLNTYFASQFSITLDIVDDSTALADKEILIGPTNRAESSSSLDYNAYELVVNGYTLAFNGGHNLGVEKAVECFIADNKIINSADSFTDMFDFEYTRLGKYTYVWGDEFAGTYLDSSKWGFGTNMGARDDMPLLQDDPDILSVEDGVLKMNARRYYDPENSTIKYATTPSINTKSTLNFKYGYLEMRAKVPYKQGAWPSFWMVSNGTLATRECTDYVVEVDIFEVFSSQYKAVPNIHKWYSDGSHTQYSGDLTYTFSEYEDLSNQYHIYGFEWSTTEMSMYIDGVKYMTYDLTVDFDGGGDMEGFQDCLYIIFNNHLFTPLSPWIPTGATVNSSSEFPMEYWIDWIRLYQDSSGSIYTADE